VTSIVGQLGIAIGRHVPLRVTRWCATRRNPFGIVPIVVYQMAKVGSSSVVAALQDARLPVFHVHRMDTGHLRNLREERRRLGWLIPPVSAHDRLGIRLRRRVIDRGRRVTIVTLVRDPIARNISSYFEHLDAIWQRPNAHEHVPLPSLMEGFRTRFPHTEPLTWFDNEMRPVTGIDVYAHPFDASLVVQQDNMEVLILKSELPDASKARILSDFLRVPPLSLAPVNRTSHKAKGPAHQAFVSTLRLEPAYVEQMLGSRYMRHFYTAAEQDVLWRKYTNT
jgi:hypothetical protein